MAIWCFFNFQILVLLLLKILILGLELGLIIPESLHFLMEMQILSMDGWMT